MRSLILFRKGLKMKRILIIITSWLFILLLLCTYFYIWKIHHVPANLELRSWFSVNLGCNLIFLWQITVVAGTIILGKKFVLKQRIFLLRLFYYFILTLFSGTIILYLSWNFLRISITNDKDIVNETGTLTVYHDRDILKPNDYAYFLYEKEGILYRRYLRDMINENDY